MNIKHKVDSRFAIRQMARMQMEVASMSYCELDNTWFSNAAKAPFTRIYIPTAGEGILTCGNETVSMVPGNLYLIPADCDFRFSCPERLEKVYAHIHIPRADLQDLFQGQTRCAVIPDTDHLADVFVQKCGSQNIQDCLLLKGLLYQIAGEAMEIFRISAVNADYSPGVRAAIAFIDGHLSAKLTTQQVADGVFLSVHALQKRFRKEVGITLGKYISNRLIAIAAYRLYSGKQSAKQISQELGFCDQFYFSRVFSAHYGTTPSEYRKGIAR